ncbi:MAG: bifunctional 4-hydroxy-2-oxoglutarate aldolase/2-dehydro-3-deoxy-phosphogluconate aldolase [Candidatus Hydromicrobium sp.]
MSNVLEKISAFGLVPVIKIDRIDDAVPLCRALKEGGLPVAEITFRTDAAEESIRRVHNAYPDILLGAGTVLNVEQVKRAIDAGAAYIISPGFNREVVEYCVKNGIAVTPGAITPTEVQYLIEYNIEVVKFFPAEQAGGLNMIKALSAPFLNMKYMPTGGISPKNILEYLSFKKVIACGGSWMVKDELIKNGEFDKIRDLVAEAVALVLQRNS